jgi:hypothetical protein
LPLCMELILGCTPTFSAHVAWIAMAFPSAALRGSTSCGLPLTTLFHGKVGNYYCRPLQGLSSRTISGFKQPLTVVHRYERPVLLFQEPTLLLFITECSD